MIIDNKCENITTVEIDTETMLPDINSKPNWGFHPSQHWDPMLVTDLLVYMDFIGFYLICPDLAWFSNLVLDVEIWVGNSRG